MIRFVTLFCTLAVLISSCIAEDKLPTVNTPLGKVEGHLKEALRGKKYAAFEGIPYAQPPIGQLRFAPPKPALPWTGTWHAKQVHTCIQFNSFASDNGDKGGMPSENDSEDCLYVNVYVPRTKVDPNERLDVIAHIHGGAFMLGSGHDTQPDFIIERDLIFVNFNYRLGALGFLSTEDASNPGNNGMKDQVMALKWIQQNIASFGGNPQSVTLSGLSAGGASVHYHYLSPLSKGLFHRGWSQSGTALDCWALQDKPLLQAQKYAAYLGCPTKTNQELISCLRQRPTKALVRGLKAFNHDGVLIWAPFSPSIEKFTDKPFLPDHPFHLMASGKIHDLPWINSLTEEEGLLFIKMMTPLLDNLKSNWEDLGAFFLDFNHTTAKSVWKSTAREIRDYYVKDGGELNNEILARIMSDRFFVIESDLAVKTQAKKNSAPVYYYLFTYAGTHTLGHMFNPDDKVTVPSHGDDAIYLYLVDTKQMKTKRSAEDFQMVDQFLDLLVNFAKTGTTGGFGGAEFPPTKHNKLSVLKINGPKDASVMEVDELAPAAFWKQLGILENDNIVIVKDEL